MLRNLIHVQRVELERSRELDTRTSRDLRIPEDSRLSRTYDSGWPSGSGC